MKMTTSHQEAESLKDSYAGSETGTEEPGSPLDPNERDDPDYTESSNEGGSKVRS